MAKIIDPNKKLTDMQMRFCQEYVKDQCGQHAAIRAGYSEKTARQIAEKVMREPHVQDKIKELQAEIGDKCLIDAEWVTKRFKDISDRCMQVEPVLDKDGNKIGVYKFDSAGANKATEALGKMIGVFEKDNSQKAITMVSPSIIVNGTPPEDTI